MGFLALLLFTSGCYGPLQLTRKVHHWPRMTHLARSQAQAHLFYELEPHPSLLIQQSREGRSAPSLRLEWRDGLAIGSDGSGHVLFTARTLPDGRVLVSDRIDRPVALYSQVQAQRFLHSVQAIGALAVVSQEESLR